MDTKQIKHELQNLISGKSGTSYDALIQTVTHHLRSGKRTSPMAEEKHKNKSKEKEKLIEFAKLNNLILDAIPKERFIASGAEQKVYITGDLIISLLRNKKETRDLYLRDATKNFFKDETKIQNFRSNHDKFTQAIEGKFHIGNELLPYMRKIKIKNPIESHLFHITKRLDAEKFRDRVFEVYRDGFIQIKGEKTPIGSLPNWIDLIIEYLFRHYELTVRELLKLHEELKNNGFENIPTLDIISSLKAAQSVLHKKKSVNDVIDNTRIACSLPISDLLITDKARKAEIQELKLDKKYNCIVLSGNKESLQQFKKYLKEL